MGEGEYEVNEVCWCNCIWVVVVEGEMVNFGGRRYQFFNEGDFVMQCVQIVCQLCVLVVVVCVVIVVLVGFFVEWNVDIERNIVVCLVQCCFEFFGVDVWNEFSCCWEVGIVGYGSVE